MRLIDADNIPYTMLYKENWITGTGVEAQGVWKSDIDKMPTTDAVPVVRCKDCVHFSDSLTGGMYCLISRNRTDEDWYCADGERDEDALPEDYDPHLDPCRGCEDYDGNGGCLSKGGCGERIDDET